MQNHPLVSAVEHALGWTSSAPLGTGFARGAMPDPGFGRKLLTPTELLDIIMRRSLESPQLRVFQNGTELHPDRYLASVSTRRGQSKTMARMSNLAKLLAEGCTLVLDSVDTFSSRLEFACQALQWWSHELVQVNVYLTTGTAEGFSLHYDDHDVVVVQLAGEKSWEVRGPSRVAPMYRDVVVENTPSEDILFTGVLRAGEVMHIPRGFWHQATRADHATETAGRGLSEGNTGYSLHATFGFVQRTGVDYLTWVADRSREHEAFRRDLARTGAVPGLRELVSDLLDTYPEPEYLAARERERPPRRRVNTGGVFGPLTNVICLTDFPPQIVDDGEDVVVRTAGSDIVFAGAARPLLAELVSGMPVDLAKTAIDTGLPLDVVTGAAHMLVDAGVCAELTAELALGLLPGQLPMQWLVLQDQ